MTEKRIKTVAEEESLLGAIIFSLMPLTDIISSPLQSPLPIRPVSF